MSIACRKRSTAALLLVPVALLEMAAANPRGADSTATVPAGDAAPDAAARDARDVRDIDDATLDRLQSNATLELAVVVNGAPTGRIGEFVVQGGALFARADELVRLGLRIPRGPEPSGLVALGAIDGFGVRVDQASQTLYVTARPDFIAPTFLGGSEKLKDYRIESGTGAVLNYDMVGTSADGRQAGSALFDARLFSRLGVLSSGLLVQTASGAAQEGARSGAIRLDTTYVYSDPRTLRRYRLGDFISGALPWTRAVRLGGAQVNSDFSMRPDLITFPVPAITGSAAVPSTVDVLVNGSRILSGAVPPGPFEIPQVPVMIGGGRVTTTVTDALGRQVVTDLPFYASADLLAPGLQTYSGEIGFVRRDWGIVSDDYGAAAGSLTYRRGLSSHVTVETHAEATDRLEMAGIGAVVNLADFALVNVAVAGSSFLGRSGGQLSVGVERTSPVFSFGASVIAASKDFGDIAAANADPIATLQLNANASLSLRRFGSLGIAYTEVKRRGARLDPVLRATPAILLPPALPEHSKILTASYSKQFGRVAFYVTAFRDFAEHDRGTVLIGLTIPLGHRISASVSGEAASGSRSGQVEVNQNANVPGEWGFRVFASGAGAASSQSLFPDKVSDHEFGQITYKAQWAQLFAGVDRIGGSTIVQGEIRGALAVADGGVFASNRIDDSFAIADTGGTGGIRVRYENRDVGKTDSHGRLLVPDLRSFQVNHVSIEPLDAPPDAEIATVGATVRPQDRSGVVMKFPVRISHGALLRLVDSSGEPIPIGSTATLTATGVSVPVGYDGEAYVVGLQDRNAIEVDLPDGGRCAIDFEYKAAGHEIPRLGPFACREIRP